MRRNTAIRSFTESVDADFPPAPELPPSLNIDLHYPEIAMKRSETSETIIEVYRHFNHFWVEKLFLPEKVNFKK